jgi:hypothetical protein
VKVHHQGAAILTVASVTQVHRAATAADHLVVQVVPAVVAEVVTKAVHLAVVQVPDDKNIKLFRPLKIIP